MMRSGFIGLWCWLIITSVAQAVTTRLDTEYLAFKPTQVFAIKDAGKWVVAPRIFMLGLNGNKFSIDAQGGAPLLPEACRQVYLAELPKRPNETPMPRSDLGGEPAQQIFFSGLGCAGTLWMTAERDPFFVRDNEFKRLLPKSNQKSVSFALIEFRHDRNQITTIEFAVLVEDVNAVQGGAGGNLCGSSASKYLVPDYVCFDAQGERVPYTKCDGGRGYGTLVRYKVDFSGACMQHDLCYGTVGATKSQCDTALYHDMNSSCRTQLPSELGEKATRRCYETALLFNDVVRGQATNQFGIWMTQQVPFTGKSSCDAFVSAQKVAGNRNATCDGSYANPFAYCQAVGNNEYNESNQHSGYVGPPVTPYIARAMGSENVAWRCVDGNVYACIIGASGRACGKKNTSKVPTPAMRQYCEKNPGFDIDLATSGDSHATWRCKGSAPVIDQVDAVDERGYFRDSWKIVSPPSAPRPSTYIK